MTIKRPFTLDKSEKAIDKLIDRVDTLIKKCKERLEKDKVNKDEE